MAPRILIFLIAMGADYLFYLKSIATYAPAFLGYKNSVLARVTYQQKRTKKNCFFVMASQNPMVFCIFSDKIRYLTMTDSTKVWMPDTFFRNEKIGRFHNILQPNLYVRVFPNGDVLYSIRVSLTCACSMHLALFPLDMQTCNLDVASCEYTNLPTYL